MFVVFLSFYLSLLVAIVSIFATFFGHRSQCPKFSVIYVYCVRVCVCTNINTQSHAHIFHWSSHFFVSTSICWNNELLCITSFDWFVWLFVSFSLFFFRLIPFIIMELATEHFVYITLRFRLRLSAALYYVMSNNIDKSHLNGNRAECTSCRAHHGHRQPDNFDDENRGNKWNSCRF